jgi:hypothetical protein
MSEKRLPFITANRKPKPKEYADSRKTCEAWLGASEKAYQWQPQQIKDAHSARKNEKL